MNILNISSPQALRAHVKLPASKSISNRVLILHALSKGEQLPDNLSDCDDTQVIIDAFQQHPYEIDIKAAGTAMRFLTAYIAASEVGEHVLTGTERMKHRPIGILVDTLRRLGATIEYAGEEGFPPLRITGRRIEGGVVEMDGSVSSQFISALLMVGPMMTRGLELRLTGQIISRPYIDLTLWTMREYGVNAEWTGSDTLVVRPGAYQARSYYIENDWSAASYWYEMVALAKDDEATVELEGLTDGSKQGDSSVRYLFSLLGVKTTFQDSTPGTPTTVTLRKSGHHVPRLEYDFTGVPDLAQTFVVTCALLNVPFHFTGLQTLKIKETDRIEALKQEMRKMGYVLHDQDGSQLFWTGERCEAEALPVIDTYEDHRMALSFAPASLRVPIAIRNPQVVTKSYPHYWEHLAAAGFSIAEE